MLCPSIDKTCVVEDLEPDGSNFIVDQNMNIGGQGIDSCRIIKILQSEPLVLGFLGGLNGRYIKSNLEKNKIKSHFLWVNGDTKLNTVIIDSIKGTQMKVYDEGFTIGHKDMLRFKQDIQSYMKDSSVIVLNGLIPSGISISDYYDLIDKAANYNTKLVLSAEGEVLRKGLEINPYAIKLTEQSIKDLGIDTEDEKQMLEELYQMIVEKSIHYVAIDLGVKGAYTISKNKICYCEPTIDFEPIKTNGASSAFLAALAVGIERKYEQEKISKLLVASSFSTMMSNEIDILCKKSDVDLLSKKVKVREIMNKSNGWLQ